MTRVGVLASGSGSNFQALVDALHTEGSPAQVVALVCNVPGARVIERAHAARVPHHVLKHQDWPSREAYDAALVDVLRAAQVEWVCLAGYMRLLTGVFLQAFLNRVLNVHPALLPSFPGIHAAKAALAYGVRVTGCTVHLVDEGTDTGPIVAQAIVPVLPADTEAALSARIQAQEHRLFPQVVKRAAEGKLRVEGRRVFGAEDL